MKELEKFFYPEDIAAAAIMLYLGQGDSDEVRRRSLNKAPFIPLRTKEMLPHSAKRLPAVQPHSRPAGHGAPRRSPPAAQPQPRPAGYGAPDRSQPAPQSQSRPAPQGTPRRSPPHTSPPKTSGDRQQGHRDQKGQAGQRGPQAKRR